MAARMGAPSSMLRRTACAHALSTRARRVGGSRRVVAGPERCRARGAAGATVLPHSAAQRCGLASLAAGCMSHTARVPVVVAACRASCPACRLR
jgi:hypothetical protein